MRSTDHLLVDPPAGLDLHALITPEQRPEPRVLLVGGQGPPGAVERVAEAASMAVDFLLHLPPALVQRVGGDRTTWKGVHHRHRVEQFFAGGRLRCPERPDLHVGEEAST
jgi:hypothetical protein